ncbi:hypothetical protein B0H17DRAFT_1167049 [Mycena rosella]|uniref:Uncharacterized protein n=1 Tax=Mycena rosella TaxID=1033263 RepID=A0AAD7E0N2_MYCRO|nr:hypothetical protein B0H17DRAFT_1167049 [Mycena rosella]
MSDDEPGAPRPRASPPPPPSPQNEEDLAAAHQWSDGEAEHLDPSSKGKGKARELYPDEEDPDDTQEYPPVNDDEAETRRVEETLKRWEVAERMKRKAARESALEPQAPSLLVNVTRRASLLWPGRNAQNPHNINPSLGTHTALNTQDSADVAPLDDIVTPTPSPTHSEHSNPFANPDPFSDAEAVMSPSADPPPPTPQLEKEDAIAMTAPRRPALLSASSSIRRPPTPKPLGLPPPRAPPPPLPENTPPPIPIPDEEEPKETRWWHDWLCGFGEGSDRGGDHQSGRTNPFE